MNQITKTPKQILAERAKAVLAKRKAHETLRSHIEYVNPEFQWADHHIKLAILLDRVFTGELKKLIIMAPPRHGKSQICKHGVAYAIEQYKLNIILATYNKDFGADYGGEIKDLYEAKKYKELYPESGLSLDNHSRGDWTTLDKITMLATGVGGGLTGRGGQVLIVDDPVKDEKAADSKVIRESIWKWYTKVFRTRRTFKKGFGQAAIIVIMTRWNEDDLAGRIMQEEGKDWEIVKFKAIIDEGTRKARALWPEFYDLKFLKAEKRLDERGFSSLYQQEPTPDEGINFKRSDFPLYRPNELPDELNIYGSWDCAVSENSNDFTEMAVFGVDHSGKIWLIHGYYAQSSSDVWIEKMLDYVRDYKPLKWFGEKGVIFQSTNPFVMRRMQERGLYTQIENISRSKVLNKEASIQGALAMSKHKRIMLPDNEYGRRAVELLIKFPAAKHDDFPDMLANLVMNLDKIANKNIKVKKKKKIVDGYKKCSSKFITNSWKLQ